MAVWVCGVCGNHYPEAENPPAECVVCADERQWVPPTGQRWTTLDKAVASGYVSEIREVEPGLLGIGSTPQFAIGQRSLVVRTPDGNVLWDPSGFIDDKAINAIREIGGLRAVTASHPHFYGSIVAWSDAFDADILLPEADVRWLNRPSPKVRTWSGSLDVLPGVTLIQCGGHFPGSAVIHWADGANGAGVLLVGDTIFVAPGEDRTSFIYSAPNRLPLPERDVLRVVEAVRSYPYDRIYGGWWQPTIHADAKRIVEQSADRYVQILKGDIPTS